MADGLSLVLWSLAEYFNYFSVTLIILCSGLMTAFIIRLNGDNLGRYHNGVSQGGSSLAYQKDVTSFSNPFFLKLSSSTVSSLANGVWAEVSCLAPCKVHVYWGALVNPLHAALLKSGTDFLEYVRTNMLLSGDCLATERHSLQTEGKNPIHLTVPEEVDADKLGPTPRQRYPCVLVMTTRNSLDALEYTDVVAVVSILHLKDSKCAMETHIIAQYAKMAGQAVYNLQPLFFASELDEDDSRPGSQHSDNMKSSTEEENKTCSAQEADTSQLSTHTGNAVNQDTDTSSRQSSDTLNTPLTEPGGEVYCDGGSQDLRPAGGGSSGDSDFPHKPSSPQEDLTWQNVFPECIVCQSRPLNCALLPCRHTCVCQVCFHKLDRCPMCRSHIESYFTLSDEDDDDDDIGASSPLDEGVASNLQSRFERFNHRLNSLFGFD